MGTQHPCVPHLDTPHAWGPHMGTPHAWGPHMGTPHAWGPHMGTSHAWGPHMGTPHAWGPHIDPWIRSMVRSMDPIHGSDPMDLNRKLARIGSHILCVLGNYHMFLLATKTSFGRYVCLESAPILRPWLNLANVKPAQSVGWRRPSGCQKQAN